MPISALTTLSYPKTLCALSLVPTFSKVGSWLFSKEINSKIKDLADRVTQSYFCAGIAITSSLVAASTGDSPESAIAIIALGSEVYRIAELFRAKALARSSCDQLATFLKSEPAPTDKSITQTLSPLIQAIKNGDGQTKKLAADLLFAAFLETKISSYCVAAAELDNPSAKGFCLLCGFDQPADFATAKDFITQHIQDQQERAALYKEAACYCIQHRDKEKERQIQAYDNNLVAMFQESVNEGLNILSLEIFFKANDVWSLVYETGLRQLAANPPEVNATRLMAHGYREYEKHHLLAKYPSLITGTKELLAEARLQVPNPLLPYEADLMMADRFCVEMEVAIPQLHVWPPTTQLSKCRNVPSPSVLTSKGRKTYLKKLQEWVDERIHENRLCVPSHFLVDLFPWGLMSKGICYGMCMRFVEQISQFDINASSFEENLIAVAKRFESGGDIASVTYQMKLALFQEQIKLPASSILPTIRKLASSQYNQVLLALDQQLPTDLRDATWESAVQQARQSSSLLNRLRAYLPQDFRTAYIIAYIRFLFFELFMSSLSFSLKDTITLERNDIDDKFRKKLIEEKRLKNATISDLVTVVQQIAYMIYIMMRVKASEAVFNNDPVLSDLRKNARILNDYKRTRREYFDDCFFKKLNLSIATSSVAQGTDTLGKLAAIQQDSENGLYYIRVHTTPSTHAMLLIKKGTQLYLFDPNFGLFKLGRNYPETIMDRILEKYPFSPEVKEQFEAFKITKT